MRISVVSTACNEAGNVLPMWRQVKNAFRGLDYDVVIVDDGSSDGTFAELESIKDPRLRVIRLGRRMGKCYALYEGIRHSKAGIIATMDADLQDDPRDIPPMVRKLGRGVGCVCGWRRKRCDGAVKRLSSRIGNLLNNRLTGVGLHDNTCPVKVFRRECVQRIRYFRNYHRFLPILVKLQGYGLTEQVVRNRPRIRGRSKYGIRNRMFGNLLTILRIKINHKRFLR
jgi:dolichol-phosphate mannosyltransferase